MPWIEAITGPQGPRPHNRDLVVGWALPAIWKDGDPPRVVDSTSMERPPGLVDIGGLLGSLGPAIFLNPFELPVGIPRDTGFGLVTVGPWSRRLAQYRVPSRIRVGGGPFGIAATVVLRN